jgi:hypothetical protein
MELRAGQHLQVHALVFLHADRVADGVKPSMLCKLIALPVVGDSTKHLPNLQAWLRW